MTEEELLKLIDSYKGHIVKDGDDAFKEKMLIGLCLDIEQATRQAAVKSIFATANAVGDRLDVRRVLIEHDNRTMVGGVVIPHLDADVVADVLDEQNQAAIQASSVEVATVDPYPVFDILERLYDSGCSTKKQEGLWWLFDKDGNQMEAGRTFRGLCVNIVLAGL